MDAVLPAEIKDILRGYAVSTRARQSGLPILLEHICSSLEIVVKRQPTVPPGKAFLAWDRKRERVPTILLPVERHKTWDRFCAAHELGHYILISRYEWIPKGNKDYWITEELCDFFARNLLIPKEEINLTLSNAFDALDLCDQIAISAIVPWKQAAEWVSENSTAFVMLLQRGEGGDFNISASTLPNRRGRFMRLREEDIPTTFRDLLQRARQSSGNAQEEISFAELRGTKIGKALRCEVEGKFAVRAHSNGRIQIAGLMR